jgi:hypothetical protein
MCKRGEDLTWRSADVNPGVKADGGRVEEVEIDGFALEHPNLSFSFVMEEIYDPLRRPTRGSPKTTRRSCSGDCR